MIVYSSYSDERIKLVIHTGRKGDTGAKGDTGLQGAQGIQGIQGLKGEKGDTGAAGATGPAGSAGAVGLKGDKGDKGDQGLQGVQGPAGIQGEKGIKGDKGDQGLQGIQGPAGAQGAQGIKGDTGEKGDTGAQGATGPAGAAGAKGDKGDTGETGAAGAKGDTGPAGATGVAGPMGETGPRGLKGDKGDQGLQGVQGPVGAAGEKGAKGDKGDQGIQGHLGPVGPAGPVGPKGDQGEKGDIGDVTEELEILRTQVVEDAALVNQYKIQTGLDRVATTAHAQQTALDKTATNADALSTAADKVQTQTDAAATAANRIQTGIDASTALSSREASGISEINAKVSELEAKGARDSTLIQSGLYETEAAGRAAVADGELFRVQGSGNIATTEYRRNSSLSSSKLAEYPSIEALNEVMKAINGKTIVGRSLPLSATMYINQTTTQAIYASVTQTLDSGGLVHITGYTEVPNPDYATYFDTGNPFPIIPGLKVIGDFTSLTSISVNPGIGIGLGSGSGRIGYIYRENGQLFSTGPFTSTAILAASSEFAFVSGDDVSVVIEIVSPTSFYVSIIKNGTESAKTLINQAISGNISIVSRGSITFSSDPHIMEVAAINEIVDAYTDTKVAQAKVELEADISSGLADTLVSSKLYIDQILKNVQAGSALLRVPTGFPMTVPFNIYRDAQGKAYSDSNINLYKPAYTVTYYFDPILGVDANNGLTPATPKKIIATLVTALNAANQSTPVRFVLAPKLYGISNNFGTTTPNFPLYMTCLDGRAYISRGSGSSSWTLTSGRTYTYQLTSTSYRVMDYTYLNKYGVPGYQQLTSISDVEATPGSFYTTGSIMYVHTWDNRSPASDANFHALNNTGRPLNLSNRNYTFFMENISFYGGDAAIYANPVNSSFALYLSNCYLGHSSGNALEIITSGGSKTFFYKSSAHFAGADGFNYHATSPELGMTMIEENCTAFQNGRDATGSNNGSTLHESCVGVRLNCAYFENQNRTVHDVHNFRSWNIDVIGTETLVRGNPANSINFAAGRAGATDTGIMWLDGARSAGGADVDVYVGAGTTVYHRNVQGVETSVIEGNYLKY